jgi:hypothetical protein
VVNNHPVHCNEQIDLNPEMLLIRVRLVKVAEQELVVCVYVATELGGAGQVLETFGDSLFGPDRAVDFSVLYRMDGRTAGRIVTSDAGHRHFSLYGLFYCHLEGLSGIVISEGGAQRMGRKGRYLWGNRKQISPMENTITAADKDAILRLLVQKTKEKRNISLNPEDWNSFMSLHNLESIIDQFDRMGLIQKLLFNKTYIYVNVNVDADDFINRGGFYGQEILFQKSVEDLLAEIEVIKPSMGDRVEKVSTIANNLMSLLSLLNSGGQ